MPTINFTGLASGIDTRAIVDAILDAERQPIERLQERQSLFSARRSALDELGSKISAFESALRDLTSARTFRGRIATVSDESVLRVTAGAGADTGLFSVEVNGLAAANKVKSNGFLTSDQGLVSDGTISIQSGSNDPIEIEVSSATGNNSLQTIRDTINAADAGVQASVLYDGSAYRLIVRAEDSGTENELTITDSTDLDLDDPTNEVTAAADASLIVDGIAVTSSSNKITNIISGVTLDLISETGGTPVNVDVAQDIDGVVESTQNLVSQYNELVTFFNEQNDRDNPGPLNTDPTARSIQLQVQSLLTGGLPGIPLGGIRSISSIGVSFDGKTGEATLDTATLRELLDTRFDEVGDVFLASGRTTDLRIQYVGATSTTLDGEYAVNITRAAEQATLAGSAVISKINRDEDLTITVGEDSVTVNLLKNDEIDDIVATINADLSSAGIAATASDDGGKLRISTQAYGADAELTVVSNRNDNGNGRRTGFDDSPATDTGLDVEGTVGGEIATGRGQFLTVEEGDPDGLIFKVTASAADVTALGGDFGTASYSRGLVNTLISKLDQITKFGTGALELAREGLTETIDRLTDDIGRIEERLVIREARLLKVYAEAERAIQALQAQQSSIGTFSSF